MFASGKDSGIAVDLTSAGMRVEMGSLTTLLSGGVSFDVPEGLDLGQPVAPKTAFVLYLNDQKSIQDSLYTDHIDYLMFFKDSYAGRNRSPGRVPGIRLGTVSKVPFFAPNMRQTFNHDYRIPVLIRIEPERLKRSLAKMRMLLSTLANC